MFVRQRRSSSDLMTHGRIDRQPLGIVYDFVTGQSTVERLPPQPHELVLSVAADSTVLEPVLNHFGQRIRLIEFAVAFCPASVLPLLPRTLSFKVGQKRFDCRRASSTSNRRVLERSAGGSAVRPG